MPKVIPRRRLLRKVNSFHDNDVQYAAMDFHELAAFAALARHLHFAKAAAAVNTSASALSRLITRLEDEAGARLFDRDTRRVQLTDAGRVFLEFAEESLRRRDQLVQ